jgi:undecaprenyl-diphosphatase
MDFRIRVWIVHHPKDRFTEISKFVSWFAEVRVVFVIAAVVALLAFHRGRHRDAMLVIAAVTGANLIALVGKLVVPRDQKVPLTGLERLGLDGYSFPSGHAARSAALAIAVVLVVQSARPWLRWLVTALALGYMVAVGLSRIWRLNHWVSDVVGAWLVVVPWVLACWLLLARRACARHWAVATDPERSV